MFSKFWLVNILLAAGVVFFAIKTHDVWFDRQPSDIAPAPPAKKEQIQEKQFSKRNLPAESTYRTVVDENLFANDRKEYLPPEPEPDPDLAATPEPTPEPEPEIKPFEGFGRKVTLYGVVMYNDFKKALITNPKRERGEPKDIWVEKGDVVLEVKKRDQVAVLKVEDILEDRILIMDEANRYEVLLYDKDNPKKRPTVAKETKAKVVAPKKAARKAPKKRVVKPTKRKVPKRAARTAEKNKKIDSNYEVINTPFGEIKRRKK